MSFHFDTPPVNANLQVQPSATERRSKVRREVNYAATVRTTSSGDIAVRVCDVSPMGALIDLRPGMQLPDTFRLIIPAEMFSADCEVRHRTETRVGVFFTSDRLEAMSRFS